MSTYYFLACYAHRAYVHLVTDKGCEMFDDFRAEVGKFVREHVGCCGTEGHGPECMLMGPGCSEGIRYVSEGVVYDGEGWEEFVPPPEKDVT